MKTNKKTYVQARNKINDPYYQSKHWKVIRLEALVRDQYKCQECKKKEGLTKADTVDHIIPINQGGGKGLNNLQSLCKSCHAKKSATERGNIKRDKLNN